MVTTTLGQKCQCQECLVMHRIKVHCFVKTVFGAQTVSGGLENHSHQVVGRR